MRKSIIIIPARMDSMRLPGKPLRQVNGRALVHWTYERAKASSADHVLVTSPDKAIARYCSDNGINFFPSTIQCLNGTARCAEVFERLKNKEEFDAVVNWQCDEPDVDPKAVDDLIEKVRKPDTWASVFSLYDPIASAENQNDANTVKVVCTYDRMLLWFCREPLKGSGCHVGVYGYDPAMLRIVGTRHPSELSQEVALEQITWLQHGHGIRGIPVDYLPHSINTAEDLQKLQGAFDAAD